MLDEPVARKVFFVILRSPDPSLHQRAPVRRRPPLAPELEILLACARAGTSSEHEERLRSWITPDVAWASLIRRAQPHGMVPLLTHHLESVCPEKVPAGTLAVLRDLLAANRQRNQMLAETMATLLDSFATAGIRALPFKGLPLAEAYFGDLALRQTGDLDFLVPRDRALEAHDLLLARGFRRYNPLTGESEPASTAFPRNEISFVCDEPPLAVDLHWDFLPGYYFCRFDFETLWRHRQALQVAGREVPGLANEELLLMLTAHGAKHFWPRIQWLADLQAVLAAGVRWPRLWQLADDLGGRRLLLLGLLLGRELIGLELPQEAHDRIDTEPEIGEIFGSILEQLHAPEFRSVRRIDTGLFVRLRERRRDRLRITLYHATRDLRLALSPNQVDRDFLPLPRLLGFLYYLVRPIRLLGKHGLAPLAPLGKMLAQLVRR